MTKQGMAEGTIYKAVSGFYSVKPLTDYAAKSAVSVITCTARGRFRYEKNKPLVGDRVTYSETEPGSGIITSILPRKNAFIRPPIANLDKMVIIISKAIPVADPFLIDKMTVIALNNNCSPIICINKQDISDADDLFDIYVSAGFDVVKTSAVTGAGIDELILLIKGSMCAFCGNSGVGKSSILNAIESDFDILTGDVSSKLGRGKHTTRHVEFYDITAGSVVADTPGFSAFDTGYIADKEQLQNLFPEFAPFLGQCRFDDCAHVNEPGCAVLEAYKLGRISKSRHESYVKLYKKAAGHNAWENNKS